MARIVIDPEHEITARTIKAVGSTESGDLANQLVTHLYTSKTETMKLLTPEVIMKKYHWPVGDHKWQYLPFRLNRWIIQVVE